MASCEPKQLMVFAKDIFSNEQLLKKLKERIIEELIKEKLINEKNTLEIFFIENKLQIKVDVENSEHLTRTIIQKISQIISEENLSDCEFGKIAEEQHTSKPSLVKIIEEKSGPIFYSFENFPFCQELEKKIKTNSSFSKDFMKERENPVVHSFYEFESKSENIPTKSKKHRKHRNDNETIKKGWVLVELNDNEEDQNLFWQGVYSTLIHLFQSTDYLWESMKSDVPPMIFVGILCNLFKIMGFYEKRNLPDFSKIIEKHQRSFTSEANLIKLPDISIDETQGPFAKILLTFFQNEKEIKKNAKKIPLFRSSFSDIEKKLLFIFFGKKNHQKKLLTEN